MPVIISPLDALTFREIEFNRMFETTLHDDIIDGRVFLGQLREELWFAIGRIFADHIASHISLTCIHKFRVWVHNIQVACALSLT